MPHLFQLATLPPTWTCMVDVTSSFAFTTTYSPEHIPSPAPQDIHMTSTSPSVSSGSDQATVKGGAKSKQSPSENAKLSVFDILNIFHRRWFLSRACLLANTISAQKDEDGNISWVEFTPPYHSHLVKCAVMLVPHPVLTVEKVMFVYILELLNGKGNLAFFDLQTEERCKANNAQKEKRRLAPKRSRASKMRKGNGKLRKRPNFPRATQRAITEHADASSSPAKLPRSTNAPIPKWHVYQGKQPADRPAQGIPTAKAGQSPLPHPPHTPPLKHDKLGVNAQAH